MAERVCRITCLVGVLGICTYTDMRRKEISMITIGVFAIPAVILNFIFVQESIWQQVGGLCVGIVLLIISKVSKGAVGEGDGYLLMITGLLLGLWGNLQLLMGALLLAAIFSSVLLIMNQADKKKELPFVPFLFISYMGMLL